VVRVPSRLSELKLGLPKRRTMSSAVVLPFCSSVSWALSMVGPVLAHPASARLNAARKSMRMIDSRFSKVVAEMVTR
jgi:hypothetical protein